MDVEFQDLVFKVDKPWLFKGTIFIYLNFKKSKS